jgi:hypothetical protein
MSESGVTFTCTDCGAKVWQAAASTAPRCYICDWLTQHPDCPSWLAERLRRRVDQEPRLD